MKLFLYKIIMRFFKRFGYKLNKIQIKKQKIKFNYNLNNLMDEPLNADFHYQLAIDADKNCQHYLAFSEIKTAFFLNPKSEKISKMMIKFKDKIPKLILMRHNLYFRYLTLSNEIKSKENYKNAKILDVGGGEGRLASFIPDVSYCLIEPQKNGISGLNIPFADKSFDYVVSCHVLEHIPIQERDSFLESLISKAKKEVILLNPFYVDGTFTNERLELMIDLTDAKWAKEHLDLDIPTIKYIENFLNLRNLKFKYRANGNFLLSMTSFLLDHYANRSGANNDLIKINSFYNKNFSNLINKQEISPNDFLVTITLDTGN